MQVDSPEMYILSRSNHVSITWPIPLALQVINLSLPAITLQHDMTNSSCTASCQSISTHVLEITFQHYMMNSSCTVSCQFISTHALEITLKLYKTNSSCTELSVYQYTCTGNHTPALHDQILLHCEMSIYQCTCTGNHTPALHDQFLLHCELSVYQYWKSHSGLMRKVSRFVLLAYSSVCKWVNLTVQLDGFPGWLDAQRQSQRQSTVSVSFYHFYQWFVSEI